MKSAIALKFDYDQKVKIISVNSNNYNSIANRPNNSRLDNNKIFKIFGIKLPYWEDSFNNFFKDKFLTTVDDEIIYKSKKGNSVKMFKMTKLL